MVEKAVLGSYENYHIQKMGIFVSLKFFEM